ncbi:MAG: hypothetical protein AAF585_12820 [Verrucomicrobiota bacterium]
MIEWNPEDVEEILGAKFEIPFGFEEPSPMQEAKFEANGLIYNLTVITGKGCYVWLRADPNESDQALPAFEFHFRCDRIRTVPGDYNSRAIHFDFCGGSKEVEPSHYRLVIDRLPDDRFYIWPIIDNSDPAPKE